MNDWTNRRILILGAARQGLALGRYLDRMGAHVTLNDQRSEAQMLASMEGMADTGVRWALGGHPLELLDQTDLVCLSGGVPLDLPIVVEAQRRGIPLSNDSQIFMDAAPCRVVGITGSAGKTTTTTLVARMAQAAVREPHHAWVGGNIGQPLIDLVDQMRPEDVVILELSSFQLEQMTRSPQVGAILNITPNHLDRHGTLEAYAAAKGRILAFQKPEDIAILGREDPGAWGLAGQVRGKLVSFGFERLAPDQTGTFERDGRIWLQANGKAMELMPVDLIRLRGMHNRMNVLAACAIAYAAGFSVEAMIAGVSGFAGVAHRLEFVRMANGAAWYNDSIATAPERTAAAVRAFSEPLVLLLGGRDKKLPWEGLAALIHERVDHVVVFGEAAPKILAALGEIQPGQRPYTLEQCAGLQEAVQAAARVATAGDVVLLSPGGTSFDQFRDFEERGEEFRKWVNQLS